MALRPVPDVAREARAGPERYVELFRRPSLSLGVYVLPVGAADNQTPHREDEVYYVTQGRARFRQGEEEGPVAAGDVRFVPAGQDHRFLAIEEELVLLVVFAPPQSRGPVARDGDRVRTPPP
jgi:mannose-6-phosphate isomerase-like protein (cupin superfamily)